MNLTELIRILAYFWYTIAYEGETAEALDAYDKLLNAAKALCEIAGIYYKQIDALSDEERIALLIVKQMEELIETRMACHKE